MDRETIKKGFELCANGKPCMGDKYIACPFSPRSNTEQNCGVTMAKNAIALLKEQCETELCDRCGRRRLKSVGR